MSIKILGIDPGFAAVGVCIVEVRADALVPEAWKVITTQKSKLKILASVDNVNRCRELFSSMETLFKDVLVVCTESQSWPRNASNSAKLGMFWGILSSLAHANGVAIVQASPAAIKKAVTGNKKASKEDVQKALEGMFDLPPWPPRKTMREHVADALGAVVACAGCEAIRTIRRML
jgi:crossover junction endodeoxyribonuclease RuvC